MRRFLVARDKFTKIDFKIFSDTNELLSLTLLLSFSNVNFNAGFSLKFLR